MTNTNKAGLAFAGGLAAYYMLPKAYRNTVAWGAILTGMYWLYQGTQATAADFQDQLPPAGVQDKVDRVLTDA